MSDLNCPWCEHKLPKPETEDFDGDGSSSESECSACEKKIEFTMNVSVDFHVSAIGCEKHLFSKSNDLWLFKNEIENGRDFSITCEHCSARFYTWQLAGGKYERLKKEQYEFGGEVLPIAKQRGLVC